MNVLSASTRKAAATGLMVLLLTSLPAGPLAAGSSASANGASTAAFVGSRIVFNDVQDTKILVGAVVDTDNGSISARLEAERRLGDNLSFEVESQWFANIDTEDLLTFFKQDSYVTARLSFFF